MPSSASKYVCTSTRLKETVNNADTDYSYIMISKCSEQYQDLEIKERCENPYSYDYVSDISLVNPVESFRTNALFRNKFCARCNFVPDNMTEMWMPWLVCETIINWMHSLNDIMNFIMSSDQCNVWFQPPVNSVMRHTDCDTRVDVWASCNISGTWESYDSLIDAACNAFTSYYWEDPTPRVIYRNVFCYICNIGYSFSPHPVCEIDDGPGGSGDWLPATFSALLNFNHEVSKPDNDEIFQGKCKKQFVFDSYKGGCRELYCSPPLVFTDAGCIPIYKQISWITIEVYLKMPITVPTQTINKFILPLLDERLATLFKELTLDTTCTMTIYAGAEDNIQNVTKHSDEKTTYDFLLLHIVGSLEEEHDTNKLLTRIVTYPYEHMASMMDGYFVDTYLDPTIHDLSKLENMANYLSDYSGPESECDKRPFRVTLQSICLQVHFGMDEFHYNDANYACVTGRGGECFSAKKYTILENGSIAICSDDYLAPIETETKKDIAENWVSLGCTSVSVLCLLITLITYCIFDELRSLPGKINMALVISMISAQLFFQFGLNGSSDEVTCAVLGYTRIA
ncbi:hypothetical protein ScPMuIL_014881 [Solemya velum]